MAVDEKDVWTFTSARRAGRCMSFHLRTSYREEMFFFFNAVNVLRFGNRRVLVGTWACPVRSHTGRASVQSDWSGPQWPHSPVSSYLYMLSFTFACATEPGGWENEEPERSSFSQPPASFPFLRVPSSDDLVFFPFRPFRTLSGPSPPLFGTKGFFESKLSVSSILSILPRLLIL